MNQAELYAELRERIGNPEPNEVSNRQLDSYLGFALQWLAGKLKHIIRDSDIALQADVYDYPLAENVLWVDWITWNGTKLTPNSVDGWDRDGTDWRTATSAQPSEFAIQGRRIVLYPPPSSTAITTAGILRMRTMGCGERPTDHSGPPGLSQADQLLIVYRGGIDWCRSHPSEENNARKIGFAEMIAEELPDAIKRHDNPIDDFRPEFEPHISRLGPAR